MRGDGKRSSLTVTWRTSFVVHWEQRPSRREWVETVAKKGPWVAEPRRNDGNIPLPIELSVDSRTRLRVQYPENK